MKINSGATFCSIDPVASVRVRASSIRSTETPRISQDAFEDDRGTDQPTGTHEEHTRAGDDAITEAEIGTSSPGTIEDQQLLLDEHGFSDHGTCAAGTSESGDRCQQMQKNDGQIAHNTILTRSRNPKKRTVFAIRHAHGFLASIPRERGSPCGGITIPGEPAFLGRRRESLRAGPASPRDRTSRRAHARDVVSRSRRCW